MNKKKKRRGNIYLSGGLVNAISGGANLLGTLSSNLNPEIPNVTPEALNTQSSTNDSLMNDWESWNPIKHYTKKDFGTRNSDMVGGAIGGITQGALSGSSIGGPVGGIIGGALGGITSIFGGNKKKKALREANRKVDEANQRTINNFNNKADNIATETNWNNLANYSALGGILPITNSVEKQLASFGNNIFAYGGQFSNGVTSFNTGGTHEENPHGGILQGVGENGEPNLVEEGELKWNDYIFSNRLLVPNNISESNLPKQLIGKTYAEAAEILQKESLEREIDPISKAGLNINLSRLAMSQEQEREGKNTNNSFEQGGLLNNIYDKGGPMNKVNTFYDESINNKSNPTNTSNSIEYQEGSVQKQLYDAYKKAGITNPQMIKALISQDMLESGNGKSVQGKYNFGNITSGSKKYKGNTVQGKDKDSNGNKITQTFRSYDSIDSYIKDKLSLLNRRYDFNQDDDINTFASKLTGNNSSKYKYAEDKQYAKSLISYFNGDTNARSASYIPPEDNSITTNENPSVTNIPSTATNPIKSNGLSPLGSPEAIARDAANTYNKEWGGIEAIARDNDTTKLRDAENLNYEQQQQEFNKWNKQNDLLRYSPILTNAGLTLSSIFSKPEKIELNKVNERVGAGKLGNYMKYNPMDFEYLANKIKQQSASTRRFINNNSGGNRATATAGILASDYNVNNALGDAYTKVQDLNNQRKNVVEEFNKDTNKFNIQTDMQAQLNNQRNAVLNTEITNKETLLNSQANANKRNSIREGIATLGTQLGQLGTENRWMKITPKISGGYDSLGNFNKKAFGGILPKIYKKKIK